MILRKQILIIIGCLFITTAVLAQSGTDTVRVLSYNILNYNGSERNDYLKTVVSAIDPDVICVQEILSQAGVDAFAANVLDNTYSTIPFKDGYDTDNHIFYKSADFEFAKADYLSTALRDIAEYQMRVKTTGEPLYFYSMHLKASSGSDNEQKRLAEVLILRQRLEALPQGTGFIVLGDFNFYGSNEPAYQKLLEKISGNTGHCVDPIEQPGDWHDNPLFTGIHTQSPRTTQFGGGANGGLDDRFDFILISESLADNVLPETYTEFGNDGAHFNLAINSGTNSAVSAEVADAIHYASDHLPLYCDFVFETTSTIESDQNQKPAVYALKQNYPNPFNPMTNISFTIPEADHVVIEVFDILGRKVSTIVNSDLPQGLHSVRFNAQNLPAGIYFYRMNAGEFTQTRKFILVR